MRQGHDENFSIFKSKSYHPQFIGDRTWTLQFTFFAIAMVMVLSGRVGNSLPRGLTAMMGWG